jgi:siroheme synthase-like protein
VTINARRVRVLVVGGGSTAVREASAAGAAAASVRVVDPEPGAQMRALVQGAPSMTLEVRGYVPDDVAWATIVHAATDDALLNARIAELAEAAGRLVNVAGAPDASTFTTPETIRAGALTVAVAAEALDPMARRVRDRLAEEIGPAYAGAMDGLLALRDRLLARGDETRWADAVESLLDDDVCRSIERGSFVRRLAAWQ